MRRLALALLVVLSACSRPDVLELEPSPTALAESVVVSFGEHSITAELALTSSEWQTGLMHRVSMPPDAGMLFVFGQEWSGGFYMKDTLIPLSIAYMDKVDETTYEVLVVLDMEPGDESSEHYDPDVGYDAALEVNQGWFAEAGVGPGATARLSEPIPKPTTDQPFQR